MITLIVYDFLIGIFFGHRMRKKLPCVRPFVQVVSKNWCPLKLDILTEAEVTTVLRAFKKVLRKKFPQDRGPLYGELRKGWDSLRPCRSQGQGLKMVERPLSTASKPETRHDMDAQDCI